MYVKVLVRNVHESHKFLIASEVTVEICVAD